jgi:hypothetical protein
MARMFKLKPFKKAVLDKLTTDKITSSLLDAIKETLNLVSLTSKKYIIIN